MKKAKRLLPLLLALCLLLSSCGKKETAAPEESAAVATEAPAVETVAEAVPAEEAPEEAEAESPLITCGVFEIQKYGNLILYLEPAALSENGMEPGDLLTVTVDGVEYEMPLCTNYSDVDTGEYILRQTEESVIVAICMGDFASANNIAVKNKAEDGSVSWEVSGGRELSDLVVTIALKEEDGYREEFLVHQLQRTDERADYESDEVFANFRNVKMGAIGENALYRSSSPINNVLYRAAYADDFCETVGIRTAINLADAAENFEEYCAAEDFDSPYYKSLIDSGSVIALDLGVDYRAADFQASLAEGLRFLMSHEGPYLVHCNEGKDRAGIVCALLECFMGASYEEVAEDYMITYCNYFHLEKGTEQYSAVMNSNLANALCSIVGVEKGTDLTAVDLQSAAENYLKTIGLTEDECAQLKAALSADYE